MNDGLYDDQKNQLKTYIEYNEVETTLKLELLDLRPIAEQYGDVAIVNLCSDEYLQSNKWNNESLSNSELFSMNHIKRLTRTTIKTRGVLYLLDKY